MLLSFSNGSGIHIITARGNSIPDITKNSKVLSNIAESEPSTSTTGYTLLVSNKSVSMISSRQSMLLAFPLMVLISPL